MVPACRHVPSRRAPLCVGQATLPPQRGDPDVGQAVEVRTPTDGRRVAGVDVAINESWKDRETGAWAERTGRGAARTNSSDKSAGC